MIIGLPKEIGLSFINITYFLSTPLGKIGVLYVSSGNDAYILLDNTRKKQCIQMYNPLRNIHYGVNKDILKNIRHSMYLRRDEHFREWWSKCFPITKSILTVA